MIALSRRGVNGISIGDVVERVRVELQDLIVNLLGGPVEGHVWATVEDRARDCHLARVLGQLWVYGIADNIALVSRGGESLF